MENFYFDVPIKYDKEALLDFFKCTDKEFVQYGAIPNRALHASYVLDTENEIIKDIVNQIKIKDYIDNLKFFAALNEGCVDPHCDARGVALNIPIYTEGSYTVFYDAPVELPRPKIKIGDKLVESKAREFDSTATQEIFRLNSQSPIVLNTHVPHGVDNPTEQKRLLLSISFKDPYDSFDALKELHQNNQLISN